MRLRGRATSYLVVMRPNLPCFLQLRGKHFCLNHCLVHLLTLAFMMINQFGNCAHYSLRRCQRLFRQCPRPPFDIKIDGHLFRHSDLFYRCRLLYCLPLMYVKPLLVVGIRSGACFGYVNIHGCFVPKYSHRTTLIRLFLLHFCSFPRYVRVPLCRCAC